jgi:hypothetical protein
MRNSSGVPSQLGLPHQPMGIEARTLIGRPAFLSAKDSKCGANLMEDNRIDD